VSITVLGLGVSCQRQHAASAASRAGDEAVIRVTSLAYMGAAADANLDKVVSFYANDASLLPPNAPIAHGREQIHQFWSQLVTNRGFLLRRHTTKIEVAKGGGLGYELGTYELTLDDGSGKRVTSHGSFLTLWKQQGNGNWKIVGDTSNSDLPQAPARPPAASKKR
jgi:ketosteroid isomerase-like protein